MTIPEQVEASVQKANKGFFEQLTQTLKEILGPKGSQIETGKQPDAKTEPEKKEDPAARVLALEKDLANVRAELSTAKADLTTAQGKVTELEGKEQDIAKRANAQFIAHCKKQGIPAGTIPDQNDSGVGAKGTLTLLEQYNALKTPQEKAAFYEAHREEFLGKK